ncbi:MAG: glycerol-3-phosphate acyltransferase [Candidatus Odinarchaeota archaeon]
MFELVLATVFGYLVGSIFISYFWGKLKGVDLTREGTGQLGGSNAGRILGWPAMIITGLFDIFKGTIALIVILFMFKTRDSPYLEVILITGSCGVMLGHIYSLWMRLLTKEWQGGRGAAPFGGIILFISWESFIILYIVLMVILLLVKKYLIAKKTIYDNLLTNAIVFVFTPFVVFHFTGNILYIAWILLLVVIMAFGERKKLLEILSRIRT